MAKTLLQLVNEVAKNMRRSTGSTITSITQTQDVISIVQSINEAKRMVEDNWKLDVVRQDITFDSVANTREYDLSLLATVSSDPIVARDRSFVIRNSKGWMQFWDVTSGEEIRMNEATREFADHIEVVNSISVSRPNQVVVYPNGEGLVAKFPYAPSGIRNYKLTIHNPQDDLEAAGTVITVPFRPVVLAATALAVEERGEELGLDASRWWEQYENAWGSMVARDSIDEDFTLLDDRRDYFDNGLSI